MLVNCGKCGNVFNSQKSETTCHACIMEENMDHKRVSEFLRENPLASIMEVNEKTGVSQSAIFKLIKNGSLKITKQAEPHKCRLCGKPAKKGPVCGNCESKQKDARPQNR